MSGHRDMYFAAQAAGIKPILGVEAYISSTDRFDRRSNAKRKDGTSAYNHVTLLSTGQDGLENLYAMSEKAWTEGFYIKPRIDTELLEEHSSGIIVLSGCLNGLIPKALAAGDMELAESLAREYKGIFDDRFFIEVQSHNPAEINLGLLEIADRLQIRPVMASDCHYAKPEDLWIEEAMLILATKPNVDKDAKVSDKMDILEKFNHLYPERAMTFQDLELCLREYETERVAFQKQGIDRLDIFENTHVVSDMVGGYDMPTGLDLLPKPKYDPIQRLRQLAKSGLKHRGLDNDPRYQERVEHELGTIERMNSASYFLIVADMVSWCKKEGIMVGPGRGSAAGSLVLYALGITNVDPIKYDLLFSRFLNEERNDLPDIDIDIADEHRGRVKDYLARKFKNVASISTFTYLDEKQVIKDAASVLNIPFSEINPVAKKVETFDDFEKSPLTLEFRKKHPDVVKLATALRGRLRSTGIHASGLVISNEPLYRYASIETRKAPNSKVDERISVIGNDMDTVAAIGMVKFDLLGLKTLSIIDETIKDIEKRHGVRVVLEDIDLDDPVVSYDLSMGYTKGVFQAEKPAFTGLLKKMGVSKFDHIIASNALVRPGAMDSIGPDYIARKQGRMSIPQIHPIYDEITKDTYGLVLYQEQVMLICYRLAGMSWSDADRIRKIIGKKKDVHEFDQFKDMFVKGASEHVTPEFAEKLWHDFEAHANYSFNKSHSVAYSMLTVWTAWLKHYYPIEYMKNALKRAEKQTTEYLLETKRLGIKVYMPDVNASGVSFEINNAGIRFGLSNIKNVSEDVSRTIIANRPFRSYSELESFALTKGNGVNRRHISSMNKAGACRFGDSPDPGDPNANYWEYLGLPSIKTSNLPHADQFSKVDEFNETGNFVFLCLVNEVKRGSGWSRVTLVDDSGSIGVFHNEQTMIEPGAVYVFLVSNNRIVRYVNVDEVSEIKGDPFLRWLNVDSLAINEDRRVVLCFSSRKTKAGKNMATVVLSKGDKTLEGALVFNSMYPRALGTLKPGAVVSVKYGKLDDGARFIKEINV